MLPAKHPSLPMVRGTGKVLDIAIRQDLAPQRMKRQVREMNPNAHKRHYFPRLSKECRSGQSPSSMILQPAYRTGLPVNLAKGSSTGRRLEAHARLMRWRPVPALWSTATKLSLRRWWRRPQGIGAIVVVVRSRGRVRGGFVAEDAKGKIGHGHAAKDENDGKDLVAGGCQS